MIRYLVDTDIASYFLRQNYPSLNARMKAAMREHEAALSAITRAELRYGQALLDANDRRQNLIDQFLHEMPTLDWPNGAADHYGRLTAIQKKNRATNRHDGYPDCRPCLGQEFDLDYPQHASLQTH